MDLISIAALIVIGAIAGFLYGVLGAASGVILIPALLYFLQGNSVTSLVSMHLTLGTSLLVVAVMSAIECRSYQKNGQIVWHAVGLLGVAGVVGSLLGTFGATLLEGKTLQRIFGVVLLLATLRLVIDARKSKGEISGTKMQVGLLGGGFVVGALTPFASIGTGLFSFPLLYRLLRFPMKKALGTSHATLGLTTLVSSMAFAFWGRGNSLLPEFSLGYVAYLHALLIALGAAPLLIVGLSGAERWKLSVFRKGYALLLLIAATRMLFL